MDASQRAATTRRTLTILFLAIATSPIFFVGVAFVITQQPGVGAPLVPALLYSLGGVAVMTTVAIPFLRRAMMPVVDPGPGDAVADLPLAERLGRYQSACIVSWALADSISINGLILTVMTHDIRYAAAFSALSLVNIVAYRPRGEDIDALAGNV